MTSRLDLFLGVCRTALERDEKKPRHDPALRQEPPKANVT